MDATTTKWSNFHVTVNLNVDDEAHIHAMRAAVEEMAEIPTLWRWLKQFNGEEQVDFTSQTSALVEHVRLRAAFEHGGKTNKGLHVHILIEVTHTTMVQVSKDGVAAIFRQACKMQPNVHCRFLRGTGEDKDVILKYITKEVPNYRPADQNNSRLRSAFGNANDVVESEM
jgi:predicted SnoaL-like aldol condensation-catalyzing enzyme